MIRRVTIVLIIILSAAVTSANDDGFIIRKNQRTLEQIDGIYKQMPSICYTPSPERWENLPCTKKLLTNGGTLRIVMLGDSVVNDTSRSCWNLLIEKRYPKCKIEKTTSVRGSTGCWWYKEPGRVKKFVLDHKPSLVMIGGISHRGDIDSIRDVIRQIRTISDADILLMTGAFGNVDPRDDGQWRRISKREHYGEYRKGLEELASETVAAFLDMEAAWAGYIRGSGKDLDCFKRDPIHANERGEQILGRILESYFSLPDPDAASSEEQAG
ncbi:MAG TPA: hypothetical protein DIU00_17615 [Phycisphaerales bacterium]|nr:hypothetical protein [Phycisphaerales bacterium]